MLRISLNKDSYFEDQVVSGTVTFEPRMDICLYDIYIKLRAFEYFMTIEENGQTISDLNNYQILQKSLDIHTVLKTSKKDSYSVKSVSYQFPFEFNIPKDLAPSFEFPQIKKRASLRYIITVEVSSNSLSPVTEEYLFIKARPKLTSSQLRNEAKCNIKNAGFISRGESKLALIMNKNNIIMGDNIPFTAEIDNERCGVNIKEIKVTVARTVTFKKNGAEYPLRNIIIKKIYPVKVLKNSRGSFSYDDICMKDSNLKDFKYSRELNPYPNRVDDLNMLMPTMCSKLITCEYSLKISCYFDLSVLSKDRTRIIVPLYIAHQTPMEYESEKSGNNLTNNNYGNSNYNNNYGNNNYNNNYGNNNYINNY